MKKTYAAFIICIIATILTVSCKKDDTLRYGNVTMGNLVDGKFISDQGNTFNMVEMNATVDLKKFRRGIMRCDVLREVGENEYDVRVTYMDTVLTKKPVAASVRRRWWKTLSTSSSSGLQVDISTCTSSLKSR